MPSYFWLSPRHCVCKAVKIIEIWIICSFSREYLPLFLETSITGENRLTSLGFPSIWDSSLAVPCSYGSSNRVCLKLLFPLRFYYLCFLPCWTVHLQCLAQKQVHSRGSDSKANSRYAELREVWPLFLLQAFQKQRLVRSRHFQRQIWTKMSVWVNILLWEQTSSVSCMYVSSKTNSWWQITLKLLWRAWGKSVLCTKGCAGTLSFWFIAFQEAKAND